MLKQDSYSFEKFIVPKDNNIIVYGDNIVESVTIINWLYDFNSENMEFIGVKYASLSEYIYEYKINNEIYYFTAKAYYRNGKLPFKVRQVIKELDKPDAVVYDVEHDSVIMGFENTSTTLAGNATWQRFARTINFIERGIPFAFLAYFSKNDKSDKNVNKKPRKPSELFVLSFIALSLKYSTPALVGFYEHPDKKQNYDPLNPKNDWREPIFKFLLNKILNLPIDNYLMKCFKNMKNYYYSEFNLNNCFGSKALSYINNNNFESNIISDIKNKRNIALFKKEDFIFNWKPKKMQEKIKYLFPNIKFYQLSRNCIAGITFQTRELINILNKNRKEYIEDSFKDIDEPSIIIPIKLTKGDKNVGHIIPTDDPYNGEISAFANLYLQSFPKANIILLLCDHTNNNEYNVEDLKNRKTYKSIDKYADLVLDLDLNTFSKQSEQSHIENKSRYEQTFTTEDDVTSFFGTILLRENIKPSFLQPPCGSWSDIHLYPTDKYYYYNRDEDRGDIAFFNPDEQTYYFGESKKDFATLKATIGKEYNKTLNLAKIILNELDNKYPYKLFTIFKGTSKQAYDVLQNSNFDIVVTVDDKDTVKLEVFKK